MDPRRKIDDRLQEREDRERGNGAGDLVLSLVYAAPLLAVGYGLAWLLS